MSKKNNTRPVDKSEAIKSEENQESEINKVEAAEEAEVEAIAENNEEAGAETVEEFEQPAQVLINILNVWHDGKEYKVGDKTPDDVSKLFIAKGFAEYK